MAFDYEIDTNGTQRMVLLRVIYGWLVNVGTEVYLTPWVEKIEHGIDLSTFYSVLYDLEGRGLIEIHFKPNMELSDEQRARKDDEQDYFNFSILDGFKDYYSAVETSSHYHDIELDKESALKQTLKVKYDKSSHTLTYGELSIEVSGEIQQEVCAHVFRNRKKKIEYLDIIEAVDINKQSRAVYDAIISLNKKMTQVFELKDVLVTSREVVGISKNYL